MIITDKQKKVLGLFSVSALKIARENWERSLESHTPVESAGDLASQMYLAGVVAGFVVTKQLSELEADFVYNELSDLSVLLEAGHNDKTERQLNKIANDLFKAAE